MSDATHKSKKRKSTASSSITVSLEQPSTSVGPVFVNFPSVRPSKTTPFSFYSRDVASSSDLSKQRTILAGETEDVEYFSTNRDHLLNSGEGADCQYLPALYDPSTQTVTIRPSAPLYLVTHRVKRLHAAYIASSQTAEARAQWREQRNNLGEAFGTKKAKSQIKAEERNRVDVGAMEGVRGHLMLSIVGKAAVSSEDATPPESIPTPNLITTNPLEVYSREALIPDDEYAAISVTEIMKARDDRTRLQLLPWSRGRWLEAKLRTIIAGIAEDRKQKLKLLYYLSCLHHFLSLAHHISKSSPAEIQEKCPGMPVQVLSGLLDRFAEKSGKRYSITDKSRTRILAWICCLCLVLDGCATEVGRVAKDLSMTDAKVQVIFKSLGCSVDVVSPAEREKMGITMAQAQANKKAVLKAPVKFPRINRRGPAKR